jgi:pilus assembly protein Flp/PilA
VRKSKEMVYRIIREESGGEVIEYALIVGLIVVASLAAIGAVGAKVLASWNSTNTSI